MPIVSDAATLRPIPWDALDGWRGANLGQAFAAFMKSARAIAAATSALRPAQAPSPAFAHLCREAVAMAADATSNEQARRFFEANFTPFRVHPQESERGFLTGYYEPVVAGALAASDAFQAPVLDWPGADEARLRDRARWEAFALTPEATPVVWLRDWTELFLIQVQGSARVRLGDGSRLRLIYAGRNGAPYTSIGRCLIETGRIAAAGMSLATLKHWLRSHGQESGGEARRLMQENRSYIFFRSEPDRDETRGPIGGQGLPLDAGLSIAVDRNQWCYGLPFWIETEEPIPGFGLDPVRRLFVAQDTGSAILGSARADLFLGSGDAAGDAAGAIRHPAVFTVLLPRASS